LMTEAEGRRLKFNHPACFIPKSLQPILIKKTGAV